MRLSEASADGRVVIELGGRPGPPGPDTADAIAQFADPNGTGLVGAGLTDAGAAARPTQPNLFQIMRQVPSLLHYTGGAISASAATNQAAFVAMLSDMAARGRAEFKLPPGEIPLTGTLTIANQNMRLCGGGSSGSILSFGDSDSDGLVVTADFTQIENLGIIVPGATAGAALKLQAHQCNFHGVSIFEAFDAFDVSDAGVFDGSDFRVLNYTNKGLWLHDDVQGFSLARSQFNAGLSTRGLNGGLHTSGFVSAMRLSQIEFLEGKYSWVCTAAGFGDAGNPGYSTITDVYFDGAAEGSTVDTLSQTALNGCWFSGGRSGAGFPALTIGQTRGVVMNAPRFNAAGSHGLKCLPSTEHLTLLGAVVRASGQTASGSRGISCENGSNLELHAPDIQAAGYGTPQQAFGIVADTSAKVRCFGGRSQGTSSGVFNASTDPDTIFSNVRTA